MLAIVAEDVEIFRGEAGFADSCISNVLMREDAAFYGAM
jgi:hypothetical protein